jgi:hypothetical protein
MRAAIIASRSGPDLERREKGIIASITIVGVEPDGGFIADGVDVCAKGESPRYVVE